MMPSDVHNSITAKLIFSLYFSGHFNIIPIIQLMDWIKDYFPLEYLQVPLFLSTFYYYDLYCKIFLILV